MSNRTREHVFEALVYFQADDSLETKRVCPSDCGDFDLTVGDLRRLWYVIETVPGARETLESLDDD